MLRRAGESQTINNYIYGGVGGNGGGGGIQGGGGGAGEGPTMNYDINAVENFTMNNLYCDSSINGGTFITGNVNHIQRHGETGLHILHQVAAGDAFHDSAERYPQPRCHPETRTKILKDLWNWSSGTNPRSTVLWLHGPAGSGKSAIAQSFCQNLEAKHRLVASFFFKRGHSSRGNATKLFSTIAYQLAVPKNLSDLHRVISRRVEDDPSILRRSLSLQLQRLIVEPCRQISPSHPAVIVIDGLDECDDQIIQQEILRSIGNAIRHEYLPLRFLVASRPEPHIRDIFAGPCLKRCHHPLNLEQSFEDIHKYLVDEFTRIHTEHHETMATVPHPWPAAQVIWRLVDKSSGYFIYASTVIKFIDDKNFRPTERLEIIMGVAEPDSESPFSSLDQLYTQILVNVPQTIRPQLLRILTIIVAKLDLKVPHIERLLELKPGDVQLALRGLHSIVRMNGPRPITVYHASFLDFLDSPTRSGMFYVGPQQRTDLACHILKAFSYNYDDPFVNSSGPVALKLSASRLKYITSVQPSPQLLSLLHSLNPDFLFWDPKGLGEVLQCLLQWLKEIRPHPQALINLWEDYYFIIRCDDIWSYSGKSTAWTGTADYTEILSQVSPQLIRILQAYRLVPSWMDVFLNIHLMLNLSWDEIRRAICPLRAILGDDDGGLRELSIFVLDPAPPRTPQCSSIFWDIAYGHLSILRAVNVGKLPAQFRPPHRWDWMWSCVVRSCPPCHNLLQHLREFELVSDDSPLLHYRPPIHSHNILQWLKTFPEPPVDLVTHFEHCLELNSYDRRTLDLLCEQEWMLWAQDLWRR